MPDDFAFSQEQALYIKGLTKMVSTNKAYEFSLEQSNRVLPSHVSMGSQAHTLPVLRMCHDIINSHTRRTLRQNKLNNSCYKSLVRWSDVSL